jgi:hypothetical protein
VKREFSVTSLTTGWGWLNSKIRWLSWLAAGQSRANDAHLTADCFFGGFSTALGDYRKGRIRAFPLRIED